jgi:hypothetical protein
MRLSVRFAPLLSTFVLAALALVWTWPAEALDLWLITKEEGAAPPGPPRVRMTKRAAAPLGPQILFVTPKPTDQLKSPLNVTIKFEPRDNVPVDAKSLKVVVQKMFDIDITDRVRPYLKPDGIYIDEAKVPSGEHVIEITLADEKGRKSTETLKLTISKP